MTTHPDAGLRGWQWTVPAGEAGHRVELWPRHLRRGYRLLLDRRSLANLKRAEDVEPWVERRFALPDGRSAVVSVEWRKAGVEAYLFVDGVDIRDGTPIETRRAEAPVAVDRFEKSFAPLIESRDETVIGSAGFGAVLTLAATLQFGPLFCVPVTVLMFFALYYFFGAQMAGVAWLMSKHHWSRYHRGLLAVVILVLPFAAFFTIVAALAR